MKITFGLLLAMGLLFSAQSCRTFKRNKNHSIASVDSSGQKQRQTIKQTTITEKTTTPIVFNPGDLFGVLPITHSDPVYEFENENFKAIVTPPKDGKSGSIEVKGKDKRMQVPSDKTTVINELVNEKEAAKKQTTQNHKTMDKQVNGVNPLLQGLVTIVAVMFILLLLIARFKK